MNLTVQEMSDHIQSLSGLVKWYDPCKGFGFVLVDGFETEFLLHRNVLRNFLRDSIAEGSCIEFLPEFTPKGSRIAAISSIAAPVLPDHDSSSTGGVVSPQRFPARVKWFDRNKGYGFVNNYGDSEDVFVGSDALTRSGLSTLKAGEAVCIRVENEAGRKRVFQIYDWPLSQ